MGSACTIEIRVVPSHSGERVSYGPPLASSGGSLTSRKLQQLDPDHPIRGRSLQGSSCEGPNLSGTQSQLLDSRDTLQSELPDFNINSPGPFLASTMEAEAAPVLFTSICDRGTPSEVKW